MGSEISALHVRRSSLVQATPERVGREFTSFERFGDDAGAQLQGYEAGWHARHLEALKAIAEG